MPSLDKTPLWFWEVNNYTKEDHKEIGDTWYNMVNGYVYRWTGFTWRNTGECPYGENPLGFH